DWPLACRVSKPRLRNKSQPPRRLFAMTAGTVCLPMALRSEMNKLGEGTVRMFDFSMNGDAPPVDLDGDGRFVMSRKRFVPAYVRAFEQGILQERAKQAVESLRSCRVCPRDCEIDRFNNKIGVCKSGRLARVASSFPHFGEEDCLRGWNGSGTIFFGWCNLRCVFCQNFETSQFGEGAEATAAELAQIMLDLQRIGCH